MAQTRSDWKTTEREDVQNQLAFEKEKEDFENGTWVLYNQESLL